MKKAYLVLSVKQIEAVLAAAKASANAAGDDSTHCIIMRNITLRGPEFGTDELQISSHDVEMRAQGLDEFRAQRNASDMAQSVREYLGIV